MPYPLALSPGPGAFGCVGVLLEVATRAWPLPYGRLCMAHPCPILLSVRAFVRRAYMRWRLGKLGSSHACIPTCMHVDSFVYSTTNLSSRLTDNESMC